MYVLNNDKLSNNLPALRAGGFENLLARNKITTFAILYAPVTTLVNTEDVAIICRPVGPSSRLQHAFTLLSKC